MAGCPNGARPTPGAENLQVWIDRANLALDVANLISTYTPLAWASLVASLVDIPAICAENPDPPDPITVDDILRETAAIPTAGVIGSHAVMEKAYRTLRYQQFLAHCECLPPAPPSGLECPYVNASVTLGPQQVSAAIPYEISDAAWATYGLPSGTPPRTGLWTRSSSYTSGPLASDELFLETSFDQSSWSLIEDLRYSSGAPVTCRFVDSTRIPGITQHGFVRIRNNTQVSTRSVTGFGYCFCALQVTAPPLPVQPPITTIPAPPLHSCDDATICAQIAELAHRLSILAGQVSDIQAAVTATSLLQVLSSQAISGEGQINLPLGTKAVSIELTQLGPEAFTSALGRPRGLMRVGSVRWWDGTGYSPRRFIDGDRYDDARPVGALAISYQLLTGTSGILKFLV